ncbi:MAG: hypothetical protein HYZ65_00290 [Burkholderiales bacterium]|nr:hypothetical protein [Burkholderiales bacterium]
MPANKTGKLICVGAGMRMAGQLTPVAKSYIETCDVVIPPARALQTDQAIVDRLSALALVLIETALRQCISGADGGLQICAFHFSCS